jgi:hypothetical protein
VLDEHPDVASAESLLGQVLRQHHTPVELESHGFTAGMRVTNLGAISPVRMIQIVRTQAVWPFGPVSGPRISYFCP